MKKEIDPRLVYGVIGLVVLIVGFILYRNFTNSPSAGGAITPQQAGLGKPVLPSIPGPSGSAAGTK